MVIRQLTQNRYDSLCKDLSRYGHTPPLCPHYMIPLTINDREYTLCLQPDSHCKVAVLYAVEVLREEDGVSHILITQNLLLSSFLEIILHQGVRGIFLNHPQAPLLREYDT